MKKVEHNKKWPEQKQALSNEPLFCNIDFIKSPQWGLEGHIAICDALLGRNNTTIAPPTESVKLVSAPRKDRLLKPIAHTHTSIGNTMTVSLSVTAQDQETPACHQLLMPQEKLGPQTIEVNNAKTKGVTSSSSDININRPKDLQKTIFAMARKINAENVPPKRVTKEFSLSVGQTVFMNIAEWFTAIAPCPSKFAESLFVRGEVVMSTGRNKPKYTLSFPQLGRFVNESVLTRSGQYLEVSIIILYFLTYYYYYYIHDNFLIDDFIL